MNGVLSTGCGYATANYYHYDYLSADYGNYYYDVDSFSKRANSPLVSFDPTNIARVTSGGLTAQGASKALTTSAASGKITLSEEQILANYDENVANPLADLAAKQLDYILGNTRGEANERDRLHTNVIKSTYKGYDGVADQGLAILKPTWIGTTGPITKDTMGAKYYDKMNNAIYGRDKASDYTFLEGYTYYYENGRFAQYSNLGLLNDYAKSNLIKTAFGEAEIFLDIDDSNDISIGGAELLRGNYELFNLDSNDDAVIDKRDKYFDKLKVRAYDINGNEIVKKLSDVADSIDLRDFIKSSSQIKEETGVDINSYRTFKPEVRYEKITEGDRAELAKLADKDGWINIKENEKFFTDRLTGAVKGLAYAKSSADGGVRLQELIDDGAWGVTYGGYEDNAKGYASAHYAQFMELYRDYMSEYSAQKEFVSNLSEWQKSRYAGDAAALKSEAMLRMEGEFEKMTGMEFSLSNLNRVHDAFVSDKTRAANMMTDTDIINAIRLNDNGSFTLRFSSGREITVRELYKDSGSIFEAGVSLNLSAERMSDEELNELDFETIGVRYSDAENAHKEKLATLKELGVKAIKTLAKDNYGYLLLSLENGKELEVRKEFFNILKKSGKQAASIDPKERFYPKPVSILA